MLHNTEPYGPNDGQINMGAPVNMSQIPGVNNTHSINNLSKAAHQPPQSSTGHFLLPEFTSYGQISPSMSAQMQHFQGYNNLGFHQSFSPQAHSVNHSSHWNNSTLPMNLNLQNEHMDNCQQSSDKRQVEIIKDPINRVPPLNIPQVQTKAFHKQGNMADSYFNDSYHNFYDSNLDLRVRGHEKIHMDESRRKSLENTVKLIENILINTTAKRENKQSNISTNRQVNSSNLDYKNPMYNLQEQLLNKQTTNHTDKHSYSLQTSIQTVNTQNILNNKNLHQDRNVPIDDVNKDVLNINRHIQEAVKHRHIPDDLGLKTPVIYTKSYNEKTTEQIQEKAIDFASNKYKDNIHTNKPLSNNLIHFSTNKIIQENKNLSDDKNTKHKTYISNTASQESVIKYVNDNFQINNKVNDLSQERSEIDKRLYHKDVTMASDDDKIVQNEAIKPKNRKNYEATSDLIAHTDKFASNNKVDGSNTSQSISDVNKDDIERSHLSNDNTINSEDPLDCHDSDSEDVKPNINEIYISPQVTKVHVKIEKTYEDGDMGDPFLKDSHGVIRECVPLNCDIIDAEKSVADAKEAIQNGQSPPVYYECPHCNLLLKNPKRFLIHAKWHAFGLTQTLKEEMRRQKEMRRNERREARVVQNMNAKEITEVGDVSGKLFPCIECDKIFSTKSSMKNHRQRFHPPRSRDCRICHATVAGWSAMRAHMATHAVHTPDGFQCDECPKKFKYMHSLVKHKGTHMEKTHPCALCPKMFGSEILLKMHMKSHERAQRGPTHRCTYCGKGFFEAYNLAVHERTHRNERPFSCDICNTSFGTRSSLKRHLKVSHNALKPFECPECHRCFISEGIRDRHLHRNHGNPEDFKFTCDLCPCKYLKLKDLQKHEYKVHPKQSQGKRKRKPRTPKPQKYEMEEEEASD